MYSNSFIPSAYSPQASIDRINSQIAELEKMRTQIQQPQQPAINQTFQLAPTNRDVIKYAGSIEEVQKDMVIGDTPYFSKDMSVVWIKSTNGNIKTYELNELIPLDEKDLKIQYLESQIEELKKGMNRNAKSNNDDVIKSDKDEKSSDVSIPTTSTKKPK